MDTKFGNKYDQKVGISLVASMKNSDGPKIAVEVLDKGINSFLTSTVMQEVPIVKSILAIGNTGIAMRDYFLLKKIVIFLSEVEKISQTEREKFIRELEDEGKQEKFGEQIIVYLDRMEHLRKPVLFARALKSYLYKDINLETLLRLWNAIDHIDAINIDHIVSVYTRGTFSEETEYGENINQNLAMSGLMNMSAQVMISDKGDNIIQYSMNSLGEAFCRLAMGT